MTKHFRTLGGNPDFSIGEVYYTLEEVIVGVHQAQNWWKTNTGKSVLTACLSDMALFQAALSFASDMELTFDEVLSKIFDVAHQSRSANKLWLSFAPSAPPGNGLRLFGQNGMITTGTPSHELLQVCNYIRLLGVSAYASLSFANKCTKNNFRRFTFRTYRRETSICLLEKKGNGLVPVKIWTSKLS